MDNISFIVPIEIWDIILDFLDTKSLLNFQHTCHTWRNIILDYVMRGRLRSRALVRNITFLKTKVLEIMNISTNQNMLDKF